MQYFRCSLMFLFTLLTCACPQPFAGAQEKGAVVGPVERPLAGYPVAEVRRRAIAATPFHRTLDADTIKKWMEISSRCTVAEFELFLAPLSPLEVRLLKRIEQTPAPIVNRMHFEHLRGVLKNRGIFSLEIEDQSRHTQIRHTTPGVENELFGAYECVFASVGPLHGSPRYGDVIIRLKDSVRETGWATPFSGMHFISAIRGQPAAEMQDLLARGRALPTSPTDAMSLGFDDRLHYSHYVVTERDWHKALAYQAILVLRNLDDSESSLRVRQRFETMLTEQDAGKFWTLFIPPRKAGLSPDEQSARIPFGYLEAKFPNMLSMKYVTSIEVPSNRLAEVRGWTEAKPYLQLVRAKPSGVD